ncbi:uncharacterized protein LOC108094685 [Drosophila ficusphila]|uniref:uncharacterized protein LOC108094685 n=1 Tax=Drosophila ficusphila TaxID=30025 RepID=UPI0007E5EF73|nr:uncharacterized protein LOC108094685 [Drosophila ficusphila]
MLPFVQDNVPEMLLQPSRVAFCANYHQGHPRDRHKTTTLLLARNLKFYEYRRKDLLHYIDLRGSRLQKFASELEAYDGPVSPFLTIKEPTDGKLDCSMLQLPNELPISFGKFVWLHGEIYILIHCWKLLLVLSRPKEHGANFELVAEHEDVVSYQMVDGPIPYQAVVELEFSDGKQLQCDFQEGSTLTEPSTSEEDLISDENFEELVQQVNSAHAELSTQRIQTQKAFLQSQELDLYGPPGQRSLLLEEKQPLRRFGDVWTRICNEYFVCGALLMNINGTHRLSIVENLCPLVNLKPHSNFHLEFRLYELPLQSDGQPPEDYEQMVQFWACQDQHSRRLKWRPVAKANSLPPECSAVLVIRLRLVDLLQADELQLLVMYDIKGPTEKDTSIRQLHLVNFDIKKALDQTDSLAPTFSPATLHQDFLAVIMTSEARRSLKLEFQSVGDCTEFEEQLVSKLQFQLIQDQEEKKNQDTDMLDDFCAGATFQSSTATDEPVQRIFYNRQQLSQWCGILLLRDDPGQHWHVYAQTEARIELFLHRLTRDLLQLNCNLKVLEVNEFNDSPLDLARELEASLYEEAKAWEELAKPGASLEERRKRLRHLNKVQMNSDVLASKIPSEEPEEEDSFSE